MNQTDHQLLTRHRAGDREAFPEIIRLYQKNIYFFILRRIGSEEDSRELSQRVFMKAYQHIDKFEGRSGLNTWLHQIAMNLCRNFYRDRAKGVHLPWVEGDHQSENDTQDRLEKRENSHVLGLAIDKLPNRQREVLKLRVYQDMSFKEIAEKIGVSPGNARVNYHMAVRTLRELMAGAGQEIQA